MEPKLTQRLDIDALRALVAIEEQGGVTRAAAHLGLSQSAVSHKIRRLETGLDCALLDRRPGAAQFTETGRDLLVYARRILRLHDEAYSALTKSPVQGQISLGMTEDTACSDLARILGRFARRFPGVAVRTDVRQSLVLQARLAEGALDLAICQVFDHEVRPSDQVLYRESLAWVSASDLDWTERETVPFLSFDENCFYRRWAMEVASEADWVLHTVLDCACAKGIALAVQGGMGVALLNARHITPEMVRLSAPFPDPPGLTYVIRRGRHTRNPAVDALTREIASEVARFETLRIA